MIVDEQRTRSSKRLTKTKRNMSRKMKIENLMSIRRNRTFGPWWNVAEETMLLTPDESSEWMEHVFPPGAKNRFKLLQKLEIKERMNSALIEVK